MVELKLASIKMEGDIMQLGWIHFAIFIQTITECKKVMAIPSVNWLNVIIYVCSAVIPISWFQTIDASVFVIMRFFYIIKCHMLCICSLKQFRSLFCLKYTQSKQLTEFVHWIFIQSFSLYL